MGDAALARIFSKYGVLILRWAGRIRPGDPHDVLADDFIPIDTGEMKERGGTVSPPPQHRLSPNVGMVLSPWVDGTTGIGQTVALDYAWPRGKNGWSPSGGLAFYREAFELGSTDAERTSFQLSAGVLTPSIRWGAVALQAGLGLTGTLTLQSKTSQRGGDEHLPFERFGALAQLSLRSLVTQNIDWVLMLAANPTVFREWNAPSGSTPSEKTHLAVSTALFLTTGFGFGF